MPVLGVYNHEKTIVTLKINWGTAGKGRIYLDGGTLIADHLYATNISGSTGFYFIKTGTLITKGDSDLYQGGSKPLYIGTHFSNPGKWIILGGTNTIDQEIHLTSNISGYSKNCRGFLTVDGTGSCLIAAGNVQFSSGGSGYLTITNGGTANLNNAVHIGYFNSTNEVRVTGSGSTLNTKYQLWLYPRTSGNIVRIEQGGTWVHNTGSNVYLSNGAAKGTNASTIVVDGPGSTFTGWGTLEIGGLHTTRTQGGGSLLVTNGGLASNTATWTQVLLGSGQEGFGTLAVDGAGSAFIHRGVLAVGTNALPSGSIAMLGTGEVRVTDGGLIESSIYLGEDGKGNLLCDGGILQCTATDPSIHVKTPGTAVVTNGTIAFRGITDADVRSNQTGTRLTNIVFRGCNAFRLNEATNTASGQDYTFDDTGDPLNYARLELTGARYGGGRVTIGPKGELHFLGTGSVDMAVTNKGVTMLSGATGVFDTSLDNFGYVKGSGTLAGTVTHFDGSTLAPGTDETTGTLTLTGTHIMHPGSTAAFDLNGTASGQYDALELADGGTLDISGSTLDVSLNCAVKIGDQFTIIANDNGTMSGRFAENRLQSTYGGKTYQMNVVYADGGAQLVVRPLGSSQLIIR